MPAAGCGHQLLASTVARQPQHEAKLEGTARSELSNRPRGAFWLPMHTVAVLHFSLQAIGAWFDF